MSSQISDPTIKEEDEDDEESEEVFEQNQLIFENVELDKFKNNNAQKEL